MKKFLLLLAAGVLGTILVFKAIDRKKDLFHFVEEDLKQKNFDAFPPEIPGEQFENLFI